MRGAKQGGRRALARPPDDLMVSWLTWGFPSARFFSVSKLNFNSKIYIGVGAASILTGAVFLGIDSRVSILYFHIWFILFGISCILNGISYILGGTRQQAISRLSLIFTGASLAFIGMQLASSWP